MVWFKIVMSVDDNWVEIRELEVINESVKTTVLSDSVKFKFDT